MSVLVLVVDDEVDMEPMFRQTFRRDLRSGRFDMVFALSGEAALARIEEAAGREIILLLSDVNMPGMSGLELLRRARESRPSLPVIMITAYGDAATRGLALEGGAEDVLPKPVDFAILRREIERRIPARESPP
jgi:CheY-like chemotaxis protein